MGLGQYRTRSGRYDYRYNQPAHARAPNLPTEAFLGPSTGQPRVQETHVGPMLPMNPQGSSFATLALMGTPDEPAGPGASRLGITEAYGRHFGKRQPRCMTAVIWASRSPPNPLPRRSR